MSSSTRDFADEGVGERGTLLVVDCVRLRSLPSRPLFSSSGSGDKATDFPLSSPTISSSAPSSSSLLSLSSTEAGGSSGGPRKLSLTALVARPTACGKGIWSGKMTRMSARQPQLQPREFKLKCASSRPWRSLATWSLLRPRRSTRRVVDLRGNSVGTAVDLAGSPPPWTSTSTPSRSC